MANAESSQPGDIPATAGWRIRVGFALLIISFVGLPLVALTLPLLGVSGGNLAAVGGGLLVAAEVMMIAGAAIAGKEGFKQIKARLFGYLKPLGPPKTVSRMRYRVGLVMFFVPVLFGWAAFYFGDYIPAFQENILTFGIAGDLLLFASLFVLGGDFWDKLRSLFTHNAKAVFPVKPGTAV